MMDSSIFKLLLSSLLLCTILQPALAIRKSYIVYLGSHSHGPKPSSADMDSATNSHYDLLGSVLGSHEKAKEAIIYSYNRHINGFAALLKEEEAAEIKKKPNVVSVFLSQVHDLHTTRSYEFLGLERRVQGLSAWTKGRYGQNTIIGTIDTGVWPESKSFSDRGYGPIPSRWRGGTTCQINRLRRSNNALCNRKLISAKVFYKGYEIKNGEIDPRHHNSARDIFGHGTHTASTAGGNFVRGISVLNNGNGGSPRARLAVYKVCWHPYDDGGCTDEDLLSAFDEAISDGVDVLSVSLGQNKPYFEDLLTNGISIGSFHAVTRGILVVASAGNSGPDPQTVTNVAPWIFTIAASTIDRDFNDNITLGNGQRVKGTSLATNLNSQNLIPMIVAGNAKLPNATFEDANLCKPGTLDPNKVRGKILVCQRGGILRPVGKGLQAKLAGAVQMVLANDARSGGTVTADAQILPTSGTGNDTDSNGHDYYSNNKNPLVFLDNAKTFLGIKPAPKIASYSSRGPNLLLPSILKPDVTAPGHNIIAAYSYGATATNLDPKYDTQHFNYNVLSGTSMSCPHVGGIAGLLKTRHPKWSPAAIKSAIMTTATTLDNTKGPILDELNDQIATPFAYGSGHVRPNLAIDPGLVYDLKETDYLNLLCASGYTEELVSSFYKLKPYNCSKSFRLEDFNYPSITLPFLGVNPVNVIRTLTNVGPPSTYSVNVKAPTGIKVIVQPKSLTFQKTYDKKKFRVILQRTGLAPRSTSLFGELSWSDGKHKVRSPITIVQLEK